MKWLGQNIYNLISRFRNDVYLTNNSSLYSGTDVILKNTTGTTTLSNIYAIDATTRGTFNTSMSATLTNLPNLVEVGTISTGVWQGTRVDSTYLDNDVAYLGTTQTFDGQKTFNNIADAVITRAVFDNNRSMTPGDGAKLHIDQSDITDDNTSASGTASIFAYVNIENPRLLATNASVTTTDAATLYIKGPPVASTNQTITRAHSLWVDSGDAQFDGDLKVSGTIAGDLVGNVTGNTSGSSGSCTGQAATVATIAGLAPNTATTEETQAAITTCANLTTVGTIESGVWQGTAIASAYLDADTSHISTQRKMTFHGFTDDIDTTKHYVGLLDADSENTATTNGDLPFVVPNGGKLLKVFLRANSNRSSNTFTWRLETQDTSTAAGTGPSVIGTQSGAGCTNKTMTTYDFTTSLDSGTNVIGSGDLVFLSIESDSATSSTKYFISCLWEINLS